MMARPRGAIRNAGSKELDDSSFAAARDGWGTATCPHDAVDAPAGGDGSLSRETEATEGDARVARSYFRPDIEGLRGVAVLLVVAYHARVLGLRGGYVGVDVFFVLSGYLISGLLVREFEEKGSISFQLFYARRVRRLLPASLLVLLSTVFLTLLVYSPVEMRDISRTASSAALYASNIFFAGRSTAYLDRSVHSDPLLHTWSLAVEEQFYLLWPVLIAQAALVGRRFSLVRRAVVCMMLVMFAGSLAHCVWLTRTNQPWAFFVSVPRFWEFAVGGLMAMVPLTWLRNSRLRQIAGSAGLLLIASAALTYDDRSPFPGYLALVPVIGTALALLPGSVDGVAAVSRFLSRKPLLWLGRHSYSWYLWHWPALVLAGVLWPGLGTGPRTLVVLAALGLSVLTLRLVENPIRYSRLLMRRPRLCITGAMAATVLGLGATQAAMARSAKESARPAQAQAIAAVTDLPEINSRHCVLAFRVVEPNRNCSFGDLTSRKVIVLFGDSHAGQLFPALETVALARQWRLDVHVKAACPSATLSREVRHSTLGRTYFECTAWRRKAMEEIAATRPVAVVLSNSHAYVGRDGGRIDYGITAEDWRRGMEETVSQLQSQGIHSVLVADTLRPGFHAPTCVSRLADGRKPAVPDCAFDRSTSLNPVLREAEAYAISRVPGAALIDLNDAICTTDECGVRRGDLFIYRDGNHLTASFSRSLAPVLMSSLRV